MSCLGAAGIVLGIGVVLMGIVVGLAYSYCSKIDTSSTPAPSASPAASASAHAKPPVKKH